MDSSQPCQRCQQSPATTTAVALSVCQACSVILQAPPLPELQDGCLMKCHCPVPPIYNSDLVCPGCGFVQLGLFADPPMPSASPAPTSTPMGSGVLPGQGNPASPYWACVACKYEYNMDATCGKCKAQRQPPTTSGMPQLNTPNPCWVCLQCQYEYNVQDACTRCRYQ